jgi:cation:H+ antiporter
MMLFWQIAILLSGFFLLIKGADIFVAGSSKLAIRMRVSPMFVGLTLVAFGTSAPEAAVSIAAGLEGANDLSLGNVIGSNIANIGLVLGTTAILIPVAVPQMTLRRELPIVVLASLLLYPLLFVFTEATVLGRGDALTLLIFFAVYMGFMINLAKTDRRANTSGSVNAESITGSEQPWQLWSKTAGGLVAIVIGGELVVNAATGIAAYAGVSEKFIAVSVVAIGTSLPELVTSVVAAVRKEAAIALGNILGSCIFNLLFVLGLAAMIRPLDVDAAFVTDLSVSLILLIMTWLFARFGSHSSSAMQINRPQGAFLLSVFVGYMIYVAIRL